MVNTGILGEAGEIEGIAGEAGEGVDTSLRPLAEMLVLALIGLLGHGIITLGPLLACPSLRCLVSSHSNSIRRIMMNMMRGAAMRRPISMHHRRMMDPMVCMVLRLVQVLLGRVLMANTAPMGEHLLLLYTLMQAHGAINNMNTHSR